MRLARLTSIVLGLALIVTSVGWYLSTRPDFEQQRFDSCTVSLGVSQRQLVLKFAYGANQETSPTLNTTDDGYEVSLMVQEGDGDTPDIRYTGTLILDAPGGDTAIRYPDGKKLDCSKG
jgi:hypothetical protein